MASFKDLDLLVKLITTSVQAVKDENVRLSALGNLEQPSLRLKLATQTIEGACEQLSTLVTTPQHTLIKRGLAHLETSCYGVAVQANIADILDASPEGLHISALADKTGIECGKLARIMRLLATRHCFEEARKDVFVNNRLGAMLRSSDPMYSLMGHFTNEALRASQLLYATLTDGEAGPSYEHNKTCFNRLTGYNGPLWRYLNEVDVGMGQRLSRGMIAMGKTMAAEALINVYPWSSFPAGTSVCDVGAGVGHMSMQLAASFPSIQIILQDLPPTVSQAKVLWEELVPQYIQEQRVRFVPLDFFVSTPVEGSDIYYMKNIIHDWNDDECKVILSNVHKAMKLSSRLLIHEYILQNLHRTENSAIPEAPEPLLPNYGQGKIRQHYLDLEMMVMHNSQERTLDHFIRLGSASGFEFVSLWGCGETGVVEFRPLK